MPNESDAAIGRLYREKVEAEQARDVLLGIIAALVNGELPIDRIELVAGGIRLKPEGE